MKVKQVRGMLIGAALGAPFERVAGNNCSLSEYTGHFATQPLTVHQSRFHGKRTMQRGQVTDDTEMTLALCHSLVKHQGYRKDETILHYLDWANSKCPFMGKNTRNLFQGVKTLRGHRGRVEKKADRDSQSNGCLMRCSPIAALPEDQWEDAARADCAISNPSLVCVDACWVYIYLLRNHQIPEDTDRLHPEVRAVVRDAADHSDMLHARAVDDKRTKGWVLHALHLAVWAVYYSRHVDDPAEVLDLVIRRGGDTDTNGAIAGAALGAVYGEGIWREAKGADVETVLACDTQPARLCARISTSPGTLTG